MNFLFLRGLARNTHHWHGFENRFKTNDNQVLLLDSVGNGLFSQEKTPLNIHEQTIFLRNKFQQEKNKNNNNPWVLIAISMGGMIALDWNEFFPTDFQFTFIINSSTSDVLLPWKRFNLDTFLKLPQLFFSDTEKREKEILNLTLNITPVTSNLIEKSVQFSNNKTSNISFISQLISAANYKSPNKISSNLIFISSKKDRLVSPEGSSKLAEKFNSPIYYHPSAGHDLPLDAAEWLENIIKDHLQNNS